MKNKNQMRTFMKNILWEYFKLIKSSEHSNFGKSWFLLLDENTFRFKSNDSDNLMKEEI